MMLLEMPSIQVLCAGVLVADTFVPPLPALPAAGELLVTKDFLRDTGGCAANVATCLAHLGIRAAVTGRVGCDLFGDFIAGDLNRKGIATSGICRSGQLGTSQTVILPVVGEDRRYIHTFGANAEFSASDIALDTLSPQSVLYIGGYLILPSLEPKAVAALFRAARERRITTVLDVVVPAGDSSADLRSLTDILPHTDYFLPNVEEGYALTGEPNPYQQAVTFLDAGCGTVLITQGEKGVLFLSKNLHYEASAFAVQMVDGSGAGDAFASGFIAGLVEGWEVADSLRFASAIGASACTQLGCIAGVFTRPEAETFLSNHPLPLIQHPITR